MKKFMEWCRHYNGLMNDTCKAGVAYKDVKDPADRPLGYPCFKDKGCTHLCDKVSFLTPEEAAIEEEKVSEALRKYLENIANDICPHCNTPIKEKKQIGRCVYGYPCGHRLYQGSLPKEEKKPDIEQSTLW